MQPEIATTHEQAPQDAVPAHHVAAGHLLRLARAFSCVFWGILLGLLLFFNALRFHLWSFVPVPPYVVGVILVYVGAVLMYTTGKLTPRWSGRVRRLLVVLFLQVYFTPFVYWWQRQPTVNYYAVNLLGLLLSGLLVLLLTNQLAEEVALALHDPVFRVEAAVCGWAVILLLLLPFTAASVYAVAAAIRHGADLYSLLLFIGRKVPRGVGFVLILPFTMTMASAWKAKESCLRLLKTSYEQGGPQAFEEA